MQAKHRQNRNIGRLKMEIKLDWKIIFAAGFIFAAVIFSFGGRIAKLVFSGVEIELPTPETILPTSTISPAPALDFTPSIYFFEEEFDGEKLDTTKWGHAGPQVTVENGKIQLASNQANFPYVYATQPVFPSQGNFIMEVSFQYTDLTGYGVFFIVDKTRPSFGPGITKESIINSFLSFVQDNGPWPLGVYFDGEKRCKKYGRDLEQHKLELRYTGKYEVLLDNESCYVSLATRDRPSTLWFGNTATVTPDKWSSLVIDHIRVRVLH